MQSQTKEQDKKSILHYLPEAERAKLIKLMERLGEETEERKRYQALYEQEK